MTFAVPILSAILAVSCSASPAELAALQADDACDAESGAECDISLRQLRSKQQQQQLETLGDNCASWCEYQPKTAWYTQTACCGCESGTCSSQCASWCNYQPSTAWSTQTACSACKETAPATTAAPVASAPVGTACEDKWVPNWKADSAAAACKEWSINSDWGALKDGKTLAQACEDHWPQAECAQTCGCIATAPVVAPATGSSPPGSTGCASYCASVPSSAWSVQSQCCGCGGGTCTCSCASWCNYQPTSVWSTQTDCCGCK
mmetsp:Transcript_78024/g.137491  ORF Transcript_78024/g.137491 Transcript_78024/m.137491 type:complete len:263 (+) Transcript_78024:76-864(+)